LTWDVVSFVALVVMCHMVYTVAVGLIGFAIGLAKGSRASFKKGWDAASANQVDLARVKTLD
jgi:hypothetical protein